MPEILEPPIKKKSAATVGATIDALWALREDKRRAEAAVKAIEEKIAAMEPAMLERLDAEGLDKAQGRAASISISSTVTANVEDWEAFHAYIKKTGHFHLLQKRVSDPAYRELLELGKKVAGVQPFTKRRLNLRSLNV